MGAELYPSLGPDRQTEPLGLGELRGPQPIHSLSPWSWLGLLGQWPWAHTSVGRILALKLLAPTGLQSLGAGTTVLDAGTSAYDHSEQREGWPQHPANALALRVG